MATLEEIIRGDIFPKRIQPEFGSLISNAPQQNTTQPQPQIPTLPNLGQIANGNNNGFLRGVGDMAKNLLGTAKDTIPSALVNYALFGNSPIAERMTIANALNNLEKRKEKEESERQNRIGDIASSWYALRKHGKQIGVSEDDIDVAILGGQTTGNQDIDNLVKQFHGMMEPMIKSGKIGAGALWETREKMAEFDKLMAQERKFGAVQEINTPEGKKKYQQNTQTGQWEEILEGQQTGDLGLMTQQELQQELDLARQKAQIQANKEKGIIDYKASKGDAGGEYAPDMQTYIDQTGKVMSVNVRDPNAVASAKQNGFQPIGPAQRGYLTEEGELGAKYADQIAKDSRKAQANIVMLNNMDNLLDRFNSGKLAKAEKSVQQWANAFGLPVDTTNLSSKEAFTAITEQLALQSRNMGEGMVLAGQMSDKDVQFLRDMNPQLIISKGGNKQIIKIRKAIAKRNIKVAELANKYKKEHGGMLDSLGFDQYVSKNLSTDSVFGIPEEAKPTGKTHGATGLPVYEYKGQLIIPEF